MANMRRTYSEHTTNIRRTYVKNCRGHTANIRQYHMSVSHQTYDGHTMAKRQYDMSISHQNTTNSALIANCLRCHLHQQSWKGSCKLLQSLESFSAQHTFFQTQLHLLLMRTLLHFLTTLLFPLAVILTLV